MARSQSVKILEVCRVAPPPDVPNLASPTSLPLTFFDLHWLRFPPVERLSFYEFSSSNTPLFDSIIPKLKHSLSLTLQHYLPLAGNLVWPQDSHKPFIKYLDGDGVSLTIAESNLDFYHLSSNEFREATECHPLIPHLEVSHEKAAVVALQITLFPNSGFCIGITSHHAVMDGKTSTSFMKSWAYICNKNAGSPDTPPSSSPLPPELIPFYDRTVIKDPAELEVIHLNELLKQDGPNNRSLTLREAQVKPGLVRATFELRREEIEKLRNFVSAKVIREKYGICYAVEAISESIRGLENGVLNAAVPPPRPTNDAKKSERKERMLTVAGSPRFEVYSIDFGFGRPAKVEVTSIDKTGAMSLSESRDGNGGVEIGLVLSMQEMKSFASLFAKVLEEEVPLK
nr:phenolic glucoside malonyltransferase 1-like isoform X2 [Ziziphus jujuba var. spinosa]